MMSYYDVMEFLSIAFIPSEVNNNLDGELNVLNVCKIITFGGLV